MTRVDVNHTNVVEAGARLSPESFARLARYITGELGIKMPESKLTLVQNRLLRRVRELGLGSVERYSEYFFDSLHPEEREQFVNAVTTNKTDFFREAEHFDYLLGTALPTIQESAGGAPGRRLQIWSAGCSSGEEPYTLAMLLHEYAAGRRGIDFGILGTDISTKVLSHAREGIYHLSQISPVPPALRAKYLMQSRDASRRVVRITPELRRKVSFYPLNFMDANYRLRDHFDAIFFRNVMIYFEKSTQQAVIQKMCRNLHPGGYLFIGHSESLAGLDVPVRLIKTSIYRKPL